MPSAGGTRFQRSNGDSDCAVVSLKSFGDLTIAVASLRRLTDAQAARTSLYIGPHLTQLCKVLAPSCRVEVVDTGESGVPALFDVKLLGWRAAVASAWHLRWALARIPASMPLLFDRVTWRERVLAGRHRHIALSPANNIYTAYAEQFEAMFGRQALRPAPTQAPAGRLHRIGLFPGSRIPAKSISAAVLTHLAQLCQDAGCAPTVVALDEESVEPPPGASFDRIARNFPALSHAVRSFDAVISADSLPAHLGADANLPVFVVSPVPNTYWLPPSALTHGHWGLFDRPTDLARSMQRFLSSL